jgi:copper transport protein
MQEMQSAEQPSGDLGCSCAWIAGARRTTSRIVSHRTVILARLALVGLAGLSWAGAAAPAASAHAVLTKTVPAQGALVHEEPRRVILRFSEPVESSFGAVRIYDEHGKRVDRGRPVHSRGDTLAMGIRPGLLGVYTVSYRVVSADGHPISGAFVFGMHQAPSATAQARASRLTPDSAAGKGVETVFGVARGLNYVSLLLLIGSLPFFWIVWRPGRDGDGAVARRPRRLLIGAAVVGLLTAVTAVPLLGLVAGGLPLDDLLSRSVLDASLATRSGMAWAVRGGSWLAVLVLLLVPLALRVRMAALTIPAAVLVVTLSVAGHAGVEQPRGVLAPADVIHVLAAGTWLGGLVLLLVVFWPRANAPPGAAAATATRRFSGLALPAIVLLVASGVAEAWFYLGSLDRLVSTPWGLALVAKVALLGIIVGLAARNRRAVTQLSGSAVDRTGLGPALRRSMRAEVVLAILVLSATAVLVRSAPPASLAAAPPDLRLRLGPMEAHVQVQPAATGLNDVTMHVFNTRTGRPATRIQEMTLRLAMSEKDIGPLRIKMKEDEPGHFEAPAQTLAVQGEWQMELDARVSKFDAFSAKAKFDVNKQ